MALTQKRCFGPAYTMSDHSVRPDLTAARMVTEGVGLLDDIGDGRGVHCLGQNLPKNKVRQMIHSRYLSHK